MKKNNIIYVFLIAAILALSLILVGCGGEKEPETTTADTTPEATAGQTETDETLSAETTAADPSVPASDVPKKLDYNTSSDLILPEYTYETNSLENDGIFPDSRDVLADTWTVLDGAGRTMPDASATPAANDRQVGIFYFLWRDADQQTLNPIPVSDHYKAYMEGGTDRLWEVMQEGGEGHPHYWAEPYFGYYSSNDEWVLRRHAYMLADAGIDFVFFDTTNNNLHLRTVWALLKVWESVRREGYNVPKVCFMVGSYDDEFHQMYNSIYKQGLYEDLWFYYDGKPLVMVTGDIHWTDEERDFFTIKYSWADHSQPWFTSRRGKNCWPWSDTVNKKGGFDADGNIEQVTVMCGMGGQTGRSYVKSHYPKYEGKWDFGFALMESSTPYGLMFDAYFDNAVTNPAKIIMITGWNEWIAGRWSAAGAGGGGAGAKWANEYYASNDPNSPQQSYFVDEFDPEFSRDIEPMKGGFGDNYLYQMSERVREIKGSRQVEGAFGQWAIDIYGSVGQWYAVGPEYRDYEGDTTERFSPGHIGGMENGMYVNFSGRNDIVTAKVSTDSKYVYFLVECADDITSPEGDAWMNLFINSDCSGETGWNGFDFVINRRRVTGNTVSVCKFDNSSEWNVTEIGTAFYALNGKTLQIRVEKSLIGFDKTMDFKWADNSLPTHDVMEFLDMGDAAPNGRYTYRFTLEAAEAKLPEGLTEDMTVLKAGSYNAYVGGRSVRLVDDNTNGVLLASGNQIYLPTAFVENTLGISCNGEKTYNHYGISYVRADELIERSGKTLTVYPEGLVVVSPLYIENTGLLSKLYRALY